MKFNIKLNKNLTEEKIFVNKLGPAGEMVEMPDELKFISQSDIEKEIAKLEPLEEFEVGYATPLYFYKELWDKFKIVKCTILTGSTGIDWSDTSAEEADQTEEARARRINQAKTDIANNLMVKSDWYDMTNKIVSQGTRKSDTGEIIKNGTLLYYPTSNTFPRTAYYIDILDGAGFTKVSRDFLEKTLFAKLTQLLTNKRTPDEIKKKIDKTLGTDSATTDNKSFKDLPGTSRLANDFKLRPQVRALYTNQIFYLKTPYATLGNKVFENCIKSKNKFILSEADTKAKIESEIKSDFNITPNQSNVEAMYKSAEFKTPVSEQEIEAILSK